MYETKHSRRKRLFAKRSNMFGMKEGHTIFCEEECSFTHHEVLLALVRCKRNDPKTVEDFKECVSRLVASGWNKNGDIPEKAKYFRFPLLHWAAVYGKLYALQWLLEQDFDVEVTNTQGETALHRLVACQAHERAVDPRAGRGRRYSMAYIMQIFTKVADILTNKWPQMMLRYDYVERNTPLTLCLKFLIEKMQICPRLVQYFQAVFEVLCKRLITLVRQRKLSEEFVRNAFSLRDSGGNTIWHLAARCKNETVASSMNVLMQSLEGFDLSVSNFNYETPILVALRNGNQEYASLIEAYKHTNSSTPVVKMEMVSDSEREECCCPHGSEGLKSNIEQEGLSECDTLSIDDSENSTLEVKNVQEEPSFTDQPRNIVSFELEKVVLTEPGATDTHENYESTVENDSRHSRSCDVDMTDESYGQEQLVVEKQIDLCLNVSNSTESSELTTMNEMETCDLPTETGANELPNPEPSVAERSNILAEALRQADVNENDVFLEGFDQEIMSQGIELPAPPDSSTSPDQKIDEPRTPQSNDNGIPKGISVTPVLLIKLLSEPDVSEKFQSLLEDVITGDTAKVGSTQTTLEKLKESRVNLESEIVSQEEVLRTIDIKKDDLDKEIKRLQQEMFELQSSKEMTRSKVLQLKEEKAGIMGQIKECESTCCHLKRRLSDCTGALIGLSPKSRKRC